jgi:hypothetical protein
MFHVHTCTGGTSPCSPSFTLFVYPPRLTSVLALTWPALRSCPLSFRCLFIVHWGFCLGILPVNILYLSHLAPSTTLPHPFPPTLYCSVCFIVSCSYTDVKDFIIFQSLPLFSSFPPPLVSSNKPIFGNMFCIYLYYI